jgi:hypothetical protein
MAFSQSKVINYDKERDWPSNIGMLDWDNTNIVFTKRSLIEFLKYTGTTVDTNFSNIAKLPSSVSVLIHPCLSHLSPGYASFGSFSPPPPKPLEIASDQPAQAAPAATSTRFPAFIRRR